MHPTSTNTPHHITANLIGMLCLLLPFGASAATAQILFEDDFEGDLAAWDIVGGEAIRLVDSGDPVHGRVMELQPNGLVYALIRGSDAWGAVRLDGEVFFPEAGHAYLGLVYHHTSRAERTDFGSLYIKGNGSYLRVNPWRDGNASRLLYEEYRTPLEGEAAVTVGTWQRFRAEVVGAVCHFYVGDMTTPQLTFDLFELSSGALGLKPRIVGAPVWVDNIEVRAIDTSTYQGPPRPHIAYRPETLLTDWQTLGPLHEPDLELEHSADRQAADPRWRAFETDPRGAVVTGRVTEFSGRSVAYFRTRIEAPRDRDAVLHLSTIDELALWVDGEFHGFVYRDGYVSRDNDWNAWFDFADNPEHAGRRVPIKLRWGVNHVVVRARNGHFASGGFFAKLEDPPE